MWRPVLIAALAFALPAHAAPLARWAQFSATPEAVIGGAFEFTVFTDGDAEAARTHVRIDRTQHLNKKRPGGDGFDLVVVKTTADSLTCPAVHLRMVLLRAAEQAQLKAPPSTHAVLDGTDIGIDAPLLGGKPDQRMTLEGNEQMGAIQDWIYGAVRALKDCWEPLP